MPPKSSPLAKPLCEGLGYDSTEGSCCGSEGRNLMQWETTLKHKKNKSKIKEQRGKYIKIQKLKYKYS